MSEQDNSKKIKVEDLSQPAVELSLEEAKEVKGGLILPYIEQGNIHKAANIFDDPFFFDVTATAIKPPAPPDPKK